MENYSNPKEWSDEQMIEYLCSYWNCDDFVFDCTINDKTYKTSHPENFKGSITNITNNSKLICYPYSRYPIFFNILATTKFQFQKGQFKMRFELESRERRESLDNMFMLRPVYSSLYLLNAEKMRVFSQKRAEQGKRSILLPKRNCLSIGVSRIATLSVTIIMTTRMKYLSWMISVNLILQKSLIIPMMLKKTDFFAL